MGRLAVALIVSSWVIPLSILVNLIVPEPYMDEIFHVPQAQQYCAGNFTSWDPMITTPPGLYFLSLSYVASIFPALLFIQPGSYFIKACSIAVLRSTNGFQAVICSILVHDIIKYLKPSLGDRKTTFYTIVLALYPLHWFFSDHQVPCDTHNYYDVTFFEDTILTLVTHTPSYVDMWISVTETYNNHRLHSLIVGLDVEWHPNFNRNTVNPVAILQLCVGRRCLIFQILYCPDIPQSLVNFLGNPNYTFTGVGIGSDVQKLTEHHNLVVTSTADVRTLAADASGVREFRNAGIKVLTEQILGKQVNKPKWIATSPWDNRWLTPAQVQYACVDAFLSFEIGRILISGNHDHYV